MISVVEGLLDRCDSDAIPSLPCIYFPNLEAVLRDLYLTFSFGSFLLALGWVGRQTVLARPLWEPWAPHLEDYGTSQSSRGYLSVSTQHMNLLPVKIQK